MGKKRRFLKKWNSVCQRPGQGDNREVFAYEYRVSARKVRRVLEVGEGGGYTRYRCTEHHLNLHLKLVK